MRWTLSLACASVAVAPVHGRQQDPPPVLQVAGQSFATWQGFVHSPLFQSQGLRCGTVVVGAGTDVQVVSDCSLSATVIRSRYEPEGNALHRIPVVVHVIESTLGEGQISDATIQGQIDVLNEDFRALPATPGANGTDARLEFFLATHDPEGNPTTGITRTIDDVWFDDDGDYQAALAWDPSNYLNVYTNRASSTLGYVTALPQAGIVGTPADGVVILWAAFGRNAPIGPPYDMGRTLTHEVGHYLGLYHTFDFGCGVPEQCYTTGDRICDTEPEADPTFGCPVAEQSCNMPDPFHNYMDYSDDACYEEFTPEQVNRMRCTLESWRRDLPDCTVPALASSRNAGANLDVYSATPPVLGVGMTMSFGATTYATALVVGRVAPSSIPIERGNVILVDPNSARCFQTIVALPTSGIDLAVPNKAALCGRVVYTQAVLLGGAPYSLTNAIDLTFGE